MSKYTSCEPTVSPDTLHDREACALPPLADNEIDPLPPPDELLELELDEEDDEPEFEYEQ